MSVPNLDLREKPNAGCLNCNRMTQKEFLDSGHCTQTGAGPLYVNPRHRLVSVADPLQLPA
jgi:hypothetical protein